MSAPLLEALVLPFGGPGAQFVIVRHGYGCPSQETQRMADCQCAPAFEMASEKAFAAAITQTRRERRAAARAAAKAVRKARGVAR